MEEKKEETPAVETEEPEETGEAAETAEPAEETEEDGTPDEEAPAPEVEEQKE